MSKPTWTFKELPPNSKVGCCIEDCTKYADYEAAFGKKGGLFRFTLKICAFHKVMSQKP